MNKMNIKKAKVLMFDIEELACKITGLDYDEIDADNENNCWLVKTEV